MVDNCLLIKALLVAGTNEREKKTTKNIVPTMETNEKNRSG